VRPQVTGAGQTVRVRVVRSESVGFPCTPAAVALSFVAPAGAAARQRRCRLFIPLFARLQMSWSDSDEDDEDDRVRTATAHDQSRRRAYRIPTTGLNHVNMDDHINY